MSRVAQGLMLSVTLLAGGSAEAVGKLQLAAYLGPGCDGRDRVHGFEQWQGRKLDKVVDFLDAGSWQAMESTAKWVAHCWQAWSGRLVVSVPMLPIDSNSTLELAARGEYDDHMRKVAERLVAGGLGDVVIRLGWEFNAAWFPWSALKEPRLYVAAYRRFVGVMRGVKGASFRFDWCSALGVGVASPEPAYPGDDVVDFIGADVYNVNYLPPDVMPQQRWLALRDGPYGLQWHKRFAAAHGKPMSYPEWGTGTRPDGHGGGDDPIFMAGMIQWIKTNDIAYHGYWDCRAPDYDARLSDGRQPASATLYLKAFGGGR